MRADLVAGLVGAVIVLPQGVAFATLAGMPPQYGLYAAMVPAVIAALFGSSWHLISGPTNAISIVVFATMSVLAEPGGADYIKLVLTLTFLTGVLQLAMGVARLGGRLYFYRAKDEVRSVLDRGGYTEEIGVQNLFPVKTRAIGATYPHLDSNICRNCNVRIFRECHISLPNSEPRTAAS